MGVEPLLLTEQITFRVPHEIRDIVDNMCCEMIDGKKIYVQSMSKLAREMFLRGLKACLEEKKMVEEYKKVLRAQDLKEDG